MIDAALASEHYKLHKTLVEASAVRLTTAWEVFLRDLLEEYLRKRPAVLKRVWRFGGTQIKAGRDTIDGILEASRFPFQDLNRGREVLKQYLGSDLFATDGRQAIDLSPVEHLITVRNAIVHTGGGQTKKFRSALGTRRTAHGYLMSRPGPPGTLPTTQFERLLQLVAQVATQLYARAWQSPRPTLASQDTPYHSFASSSAQRT
jgi:hypothetical protein